MAISTGDVLRVAARLLWQGASDIVNTFHIKIVDDNAQTQTDIINGVRTLLDDMYTEIAVLIDDATVFEDINIFNVSQDEAYGSFPWPVLAAGSNNNDPYAPGAAIFTWFPTGTPGVQGRKWFGPLCEPDVNVGLATATATGFVSDLVEFLVVPISDIGTGVTFRNVIPHTIEDGEELAVPVYIEPTIANISAIIGYQRRRRPGAGS
jgi:hypothetical protein